jgi:hypothetical protein
MSTAAVLILCAMAAIAWLGRMIWSWGYGRGFDDCRNRNFRNTETSRP